MRRVSRATLWRASTAVKASSRQVSSGDRVAGSIVVRLRGWVDPRAVRAPLPLPVDGTLGLCTQAGAGEGACTHSTPTVYTLDTRYTPAGPAGGAGYATARRGGRCAAGTDRLAR